MTNGEFVEIVYKCAHRYAIESRECLARNSHMHDLKKDEVEALSDEQIRAVLNDFINYLAAVKCGMDLAMKTSDWPRRSALHHLAEAADE